MYKYWMVIEIYFSFLQIQFPQSFEYLRNSWSYESFVTWTCGLLRCPPKGNYSEEIIRRTGRKISKFERQSWFIKCPDFRITKHFERFLSLTLTLLTSVCDISTILRPSYTHVVYFARCFKFEVLNRFEFASYISLEKLSIGKPQKN